VYGESHQKHRGTLLIDSVVCTLLSERRLGPHVHGIFPEGRLEEFVEAECLLVNEIRDEIISRQIAQMLGELHQLDMPLVKEPIWLYKTIDHFISDLPSDLHKFEIVEDQHIFQEIRAVCNFHEEAAELKKILATIESPVCFTHNDFQPGNILRINTFPEKLTVIDFEYCSYNYRGFDIGNHFCEFIFDYKSAKGWPFFNFNYELYPNEKQQLNFINSYIEAIINYQEQEKAAQNVVTNGTHDIDHNNDSVSNTNNSASVASHQSKSVTFLPLNNIDQTELAKQIMKEANYFALASHFFWSLWAITMASTTAIKFGYMVYFERCYLELS
ncbi:unnamed protein product, partial [Didymodactylos carnosus]